MGLVDGGPGDIIQIIILFKITIGMVPDGIIGTVTIPDTGITFIGIMAMANVGIMAITDMTLGPVIGGMAIMAMARAMMAIEDEIMAAMCAMTAAVDMVVTAGTCAMTAAADMVVMAGTCGGMAVADMVVTAGTCGAMVMGDGVAVIMCVRVEPIGVVI